MTGPACLWTVLAVISIIAGFIFACIIIYNSSSNNWYETLICSLVVFCTIVFSGLCALQVQKNYDVSFAIAMKNAEYVRTHSDSTSVHIEYEPYKYPTDKE